MKEIHKRVITDLRRVSCNFVLIPTISFSWPQNWRKNKFIICIVAWCNFLLELKIVSAPGLTFIVDDDGKINQDASLLAQWESCTDEEKAMLEFMSAHNLYVRPR